MVWNYDTTHALGIYRTIGRLLGFWSLDEFSISATIRVMIYVMSQVWLCIDVIMRYLVKGNCGTFSEIVGVVSWIAVGISTGVKAIALSYYRQHMYTIFNTAVVDWSTVIDQESRNIMLKYANIGRTAAIIQVVDSFCVTSLKIGTCLPSIIKSFSHHSNFSVPLCMPLWPSCWAPLDVFDYTINFINQFIIAVLIGCYYCGCESFFFGTATHIVGQFKELQRTVKYMDGTGDPVQQIQQFVKFIIRHKQLLVLANNFEEVYNIIMLVHGGVNMLMACISCLGILISMQTADYYNVGAMVFQLMPAFLQLFVYSYVGEELSSQAGKLQTAIYNCPWYDMSSDIVKDMAFVIMKCNYPFNLTAGKIYNMNIPNFTGIVKTIASYFSIIRLMLLSDN